MMRVTRRAFLALSGLAVAGLVGCSQEQGKSDERKVPEGMSEEAYEAGTEALGYAKDAEESGDTSSQEVQDKLGEYMRSVPEDYETFPQDEHVSMALATIGGGAMNGDEELFSQGIDLLEKALNGEIE